jgi:hypothetical protein
MAVRNIVITKSNCGNCGAIYKYGYDIMEAEETKQYLDIGDKLMYEGEKTVGKWMVIGTGDSCSICKQVVEAECWFNNNELIKVCPIIKQQKNE